MYHLEFLGPEGPTSRHPLSSRPFFVGRAGSNDLILTDDATSLRHFRVWVDATGPFIEDVGSRNGTWVNGARVTAATPLGDADDIRVGAQVRFRVREVPDGSGAVPQVEDMDLGIRYRFVSDRFTIGQREGSDIVLTAAGPGATLIAEPDGKIWLGGPEQTTELSVDVPFLVAGRRFCLRRPTVDDLVTRDLQLPHELASARYPYEVVVRLAGATGPEATFRDTRSGSSHTITAENPALLVFILARKHSADVGAGALPNDRGWVADEELAVGIWGRSEAVRQASNLNVLVWRVRRELEAAGFDAWCLEKRRRHMRLRVDAARILM